MKEHFADIVDLKFTNHMEAELDEIEKGKAAWRDVLAEFYGDFSKEMNEAEKAMDGVKLKVPTFSATNTARSAAGRWS